MSHRFQTLRLAAAFLAATGFFISRGSCVDFSSLLPRSFQKDPKIRFSVITEYTTEGRKLPEATPESPAYYLLNDEGYSGAGDVIAGERPPAFKVLSSALTKALAVNGYKVATPGSRPTLLVSCRYGYFNEFEISMVPPPPNADGSIPPPEPGNADFDETQLLNTAQRAAIVGGDRFAVEFARALGHHALEQFRANPKYEDLVNMIMVNEGGNLYYVIASVYDLAAASKKEKKLLWRTKIATNSQGLEMDETLPALVQSAAPYFGKDMAEAARLDTHIREGHVDIGIPVVKP